MDGSRSMVEPKLDLQRVHDAFRARAEVGKWIRVLAFGIEGAAGVAAILGAVVPLGTWAPLAALGAVVVGSLLREWAQGHTSAALDFRRAALRAFAFERDVPPGVLASLEEGALPTWLLEGLLRRLPSRSLMEYYEPTKEAGLARYRELVCHSAFFTSRLLRFHAVVLLLGAGAAAAATVVVLNTYASRVDRDLPLWAAEGIYTVVLGLLAVRALESGLQSLRSSSDAREVSERLLSMKGESAEEIEEYAYRYDTSRANGPAPPGYAYRLHGKRLARAWRAARREMV